MTSSFIEWQCPKAELIGGHTTALFLLLLGVLFVVFALVPGLKQGRPSRLRVGVLATGTQRAIMFRVGAVAAYEGLKMVVLCRI